MKKEDILEKSRKENEVADERSNLIKLKGANFSVGVLILLWVAMSRFAPIDEMGKIALALLTNVTCLSNFAYQLVKGRTKTSIIFTILFSLAAAFYLYQFFNKIGILPF